jgi:hypothetical protein
MNILLREKCVKETDLNLMLQLDDKTVCLLHCARLFDFFQAQQLWMLLDKDKLAQKKKCADPNEKPEVVDGKEVPPTKHTYWFIHYKNVRLHAALTASLLMQSSSGSI